MTRVTRVLAASPGHGGGGRPEHWDRRRVVVTGEPANTTICNMSAEFCQNFVLLRLLNASPEGVLDRKAAAADDPSLSVANTP